MAPLKIKPHAKLDKPLRFETLLIEISTFFINLPADRIDSEIEIAQRRVCEFLDLDRSTLFQVSEGEPGSLLLTHVAVGGRIVIDNRFTYPETVIDTMERERVTGFSGVPSNFMILLDNSTFARRELPHLRYFTQAGAGIVADSDPDCEHQESLDKIQALIRAVTIADEGI